MRSINFDAAISKQFLYKNSSPSMLTLKKSAIHALPRAKLSAPHTNVLMNIRQIKDLLTLKIFQIFKELARQNSMAEEFCRALNIVAKRQIEFIKYSNLIKAGDLQYV